MIALIAHDKKKADLVAFVREHLALLQWARLVATGSAGSLLREQLGLDGECVAHGPEGAT